MGGHVVTLPKGQENATQHRADYSSNLPLQCTYLPPFSSIVQGQL